MYYIILFVFLPSLIRMKAHRPLDAMCPDGYRYQSVEPTYASYRFAKKHPNLVASKSILALLTPIRWEGHLSPHEQVDLIHVNILHKSPNHRLRYPRVIGMPLMLFSFLVYLPAVVRAPFLKAMIPFITGGIMIGVGDVITYGYGPTTAFFVGGFGLFCVYLAYRYWSFLKKSEDAHHRASTFLSSAHHTQHAIHEDTGMDDLIAEAVASPRSSAIRRSLQTSPRAEASLISLNPSVHQL